MNSNDPLTREQRVGAALAATVLLGAFVVILLSAGHGAGPIGLLLVIGSFSAWGWHMALGWAGLLLTIAALLFSHRWAHLLLATGGLLCLIASWALFFLATETRSFTFINSLPFWVG